MSVSFLELLLLWQRHLGFWSGFWVKVLFQIFLGDNGLHAIGGNSRFRGPEDRVEHQPLRHFANNRTPALCSCAPGPWLGFPAMSTMFFFSAACAESGTSANPKMIESLGREV